MAAWLKMGVDLPEKPEVWQIASRCGLDPDAVVGKLLKVWRWFDSHTENGNAAGVTVSIIDHVATATGFGDAMVACGWLLASDAGLELPKFDRHNGETAKKRALTAKRVGAHRGSSNADANATGNAGSVTKSVPRVRERSNTPIAPKGATDGDESQGEKPAKRGQRMGWAEFATACAEQGEELIPADHAVFAYAERIALPAEFVSLAWGWFKERHADKRQQGVRGWRQAFGNCVRENWGKLWWDNGGVWELTTAGKQALRAAQAGEA